VRFDKDFAEYDKKKRGQDFSKLENKIETKRAQHLHREETKWNRMENEFMHASDIIEKKRNNIQDAGTYSNG